MSFYWTNNFKYNKELFVIFAFKKNVIYKKKLKSYILKDRKK